METRLFPYETVREEQDKLITAVMETINSNGTLVAHAPTGLGKTVATLAPAIELAEGKVVVFMTSRLTHHKLALETVSQIKQKHNLTIGVVDLIGKQHFCLQPGVQGLNGKEFAEYCKAMREDDLCEFYTNLKRGEELSPMTKTTLVQLGKTAPNTPEVVKHVSEEAKLCPYEVTMLAAKDATVIICDYSYIFNPRIRDGFFSRIGKQLEDCILVVDEGHNLPSRVKDLASERITTGTLKRAIRELEKHDDTHVHHLKQLYEFIESLGKEEEQYITRSRFLEGIENITPLEPLIDALQDVGRLVREEQRSSSAGALGDFLDIWQENKEGFTRILTVRKGEQESLTGKQDTYWTLSYRCLDPSLITGPVFQEAHASIVMSGTLTPVPMYAELLGCMDAQQMTLTSPFPHSNRLNLIVPKTTTSFKKRSPAMYEEIAETCAGIAETIPGNIAIFFPSYHVMQEVREYFEHRTSKTIFTEHSGFTKQEKDEFLDRFRQYKHTGAVLLGVMGGSFSEGIDLPGNELKGVVIVGLPLGRPDLETKALIEYYDEKFGKGWEYGYTFPAFNRTLQSAGRCIRTEKDKGVIVFLDERYAWQNYHQCFPKDWHIKMTLLYEDVIKEFYGS